MIGTNAKTLQRWCQWSIEFQMEDFDTQSSNCSVRLGQRTHMTANMVRNVCQAFRHLPIVSVTLWIDSMIALYGVVRGVVSTRDKS